MVAQLVKNLPAVWETWVRSLGWKDPLEKGMATHSRILTWRTPWTIAYQAPPSMGFSRQEHWSGLPFPSPGDLPDPEIEPGSPTLQADALPSEPPGKSKLSVKVSVNKNVLLSSYQIQRPLNSIHKLQVKNF